jgi:hypothetical protein
MLIFGSQLAPLAASAPTPTDSLSTATRRELGQVRSATAKYHDLDKAIADGYVNIDVFVPGQGFHYLKPSLVDGTFELDKPELLVYALDPTDKRLRLVSVEYAVPLALSATAPEGFSGEDDVWSVNSDFGLWTLHCWVWLQNPNGIFAEFSPRVP